MNQIAGQWIGIALGLASTVITALIVYRAQQKDRLKSIEHKIDDFRAKLQGLTQLVPKLPEPRKGLGGKILAYFEEVLEKAREGLDSESETVDLHNFKRGWELLFDDLFTDGGSGKKILRDFTISSHGELSFGGYDFPGYVDILRDRLHSAKAKGRRNIQVRALILCNSSHESDACNIAVEKHLDRFLDIKFPHLDKEIGSKKLREWKDADAKRKPEPEIEIRLIGRSPAEDVYRNSDIVQAPFNVYGTRAASRSIVTATGLDHPVPHLEVFLNPAIIGNYTDLFDNLWNEAMRFQEKIMNQLSTEDMEKMGSGNLIRDWSSLQM